MIAAQNLRVRVGRHVLLDDVSLRLAPGTLTAVLGANGAGKTTLLRALAGEQPPDGGSVCLDGTPIGTLDPRVLARRRAVLSQRGSLAFGLTVADVVALGRLPHRATPAQRDDRAALAAVRDDFSLAALWDRAYPTLSGGERQRTQLARAAAQLWHRDGDQSGQALFLDEPAAALDLAQQRTALAFAAGMAARGAVVLAVLHDPNQAARADQVVLLRAGILQAAGPTRDVLTPAGLAACLDVEIECLVRADGGSAFVVT